LIQGLAAKMVSSRFSRFLMNSICSFICCWFISCWLWGMLRAGEEFSGEKQADPCLTVVLQVQRVEKAGGRFGKIPGQQMVSAGISQFGSLPEQQQYA